MQHLPADTPIYGLQAVGLSTAGTMPDSVADMAADYIARIRAIQPDGPYQLLGWSFGGLIAHEIAVQLQAVGERVTLLALLDTVHKLRQGWSNGLRAALGRNPAIGGRDRAELLAELRWEQATDLGVDDELLSRIFDVSASNANLASRHTPSRYAGDMVLIQSRDEDQRSPEENDWGPYVGGAVEKHPLDCDHLDMAQPVPSREISRIIAEKLHRSEGVV